MIAVMYAILLGLLCPTHGSAGNGQDTVQTASGDEGGVGGDVGTVRPPRPPQSN